MFSNITTQLSVKVKEIGREAGRHEMSDFFSAEEKEKRERGGDGAMGVKECYLHERKL